MGTIYRKQWTADNGHTYTLDIVPYDSNVDDAVVNLSSADANLIEVGTIQHGFDELPIGLMKPPSMTLRMVINRLPSALQTYIRNKVDTASASKPRNLFVLKTDGGVGATTVLFCGVQTKINSQSYERVSGEYIVEIECTDAVNYVMTQYKPTSTSFFSSWDVTFSAPYDTQTARKGIAFELLNSASGSGIAMPYVKAQANEFAQFWTLSLIMSVFSVELGNLMETVATRQTTAGNPFDYYGELAGNAITNVAKFRRSNRTSYTSSRTASSYLNADQLYLMTHIVANDTLVGGLASPNDKYGWGKYESHWDLFKDLFECLFCKASYYYEIGTGTDANKVVVVWEVNPVVGPVSTEIDIMRSLDEPVITETESAIGRCEVRFSTEYPDQTASQHIANAGTARADRQYTVDMLLHNCPIHKNLRTVVTSGVNVAGLGFIHCNQLYFRDTAATLAAGSDNLVKTHENLSLSYTGALDFDYDESTISHNPPKDVNAYSTWAIGTQQVTGLPFALADAYVKLFGQDTLATVEMRLPMTYRTITNIAETRPITGSVTTDIPHLSWSRAVPVSVETNVMEGTQTVKFMLIPIPS